jgi:hypothetical protein
VTYDWRPTGTRSATTDPTIVVPSPGHASVATPSGPPGDSITAAAAIDEFVEAAEAGRAVNRSGRPYKPSALRDMRGILEYHVAPELGDTRLRDVRREHVQALVDRLGADGLSESRIRSVVSALRALYGYAIERGHVEFNPADALVMPRADDRVDATSSRSDERDELWHDQPGWEARPTWDRRFTAGGAEPRPPDERSGGARRGRGKRDRDREAYAPSALLRQRILSLALRAVFVLFALIVLASVLESV